MSRNYKSGTKWCVWRWTRVPSDFIRRLHVVHTPFGSVCIHWIKQPDQEPYPHDHPVDFLSIILRGGYAETKNGAYRVRRLFNFIHATDAHHISAVEEGTVTLCLMSGKKRDWGYHTAAGWIGWKAYNARYKA